MTSFGFRYGYVYNERYANGCTMIVSTEVFVRLRNMCIVHGGRKRAFPAGHVEGGGEGKKKPLFFEKKRRKRDDNPF